MTDRFHFAYPIEVRFRDIDSFGHVNNAVYFTYMEQARISYMRQLGLRPDHPEDAYFIIAEATCQFKAPVPFDMTLVVRVRVSEIRRSSFVMEYRIEDQATGQVMALGKTANVAYDYALGKSMPLPSEWRERIDSFEQRGQ
jgi:acyl-CoA thioester hydrolase